MIDAHAHILPDFVQEIDEVLLRARSAGLRAVISSAIEPHHFDYAVELEKRNINFIYTCLGFSPSYIKKIDFDLAYSRIKNNQTLVAIGEVGLDYHWIRDSFWQKKEQEVFLKFIELANERGKPLVIHSRKAETDCINILEKHAEVNVLMHCFAGNLDEVKRIIDLGWFISIPTAVVNRKKHRRIARNVPIEHLVVETDTPFLSPLKGQPNEPKNVKYAIEEIAILKDDSFNEISRITTQNAIDFYQIN